MSEATSGSSLADEAVGRKGRSDFNASFRGARQREPGIQALAPSVESLDSGFRLSSRPRNDAERDLTRVPSGGVDPAYRFAHAGYGVRIWEEA
jgi:hypothetical protein